MKKILLLLLICGHCNAGFCQAHTKEEILDWLTSKIEALDPTYKKISKKYFSNGSLQYTNYQLQWHDEYYGYDYVNILDFYNLSSYTFTDNKLVLKGYLISHWKEAGVLNAQNNYSNSVELNLDLSVDPTIQGRITNSLNDLLLILRNERKNSVETY